MSQRKVLQEVSGADAYFRAAVFAQLIIMDKIGRGQGSDEIAVAMLAGGLFKPGAARASLIPDPYRA